MTDELILSYTERFRNAINEAQRKGLFDNYLVFQKFPEACCGISCYLLAEYLKNNGIETIYVCGNQEGQSHAWLIVNDKRVKKPNPKILEYAEIELPLEVKGILTQYENCAKTGKETIDEYIIEYDGDGLREGLILDITGDQFGQPQVYVGRMNDFYEKFRFEYAHICRGVENHLDVVYSQIYEIIVSQMGN